MSLFGKNKIRMDMIRAITPTSKASLKSQCLIISKGDIEQADKLYDYFTRDMPDMPAYDAPAPNWVDNTKDTLNGLFSFFGSHKDGLTQGYEILRAMFNARGANLPPLGGVAEDVAETAESLPPINE